MFLTNVELGVNFSAIVNPSVGHNSKYYGASVHSVPISFLLTSNSSSSWLCNELAVPVARIPWIRLAFLHD